MDFDALVGFGVEGGVIEAWKSGFGKNLLPVQERALRGGLLAGKNLIVFAPTSSGKTAIGEMAAVKAAREGRRVFYLVPLKALAEEKYAEFRARYDPLGLEVVITSRDRSEFDERILGGRYRLAVCTFEKLWSLLVARPVLVDSIGLVVVDELQMISDPERGGTLELLLTQMRLAKSAPQIVGLSAVLEQADGLAKWLGAQKITETIRPVELRKGVLLNGTFQYLEHNSGQPGSEKFFDWRTNVRPDEDERLELALLGSRHLAQALGEQTLVFVSDRHSAVMMARKILPLLTLPAASAAIEEMRDFEECEAKEALSDLLEGGVAFHHADLSQSYRSLVERHFREGGIRILFSTPTLAMGMNLPARNVVILPHRWRRDPRHGWITEPLTRMEFENVAGRAARLGFGDAFGRAIVPESSAFEKDLLFDRYLKSPFEPLAPALGRGGLDEALLSLAASGVARTVDEIAGFLSATFSGAPLLSEVPAALDRLSQGGLIRLRDARAEATELGLIVARHGLQPSTGIALDAWAKVHADSTELESIAAVAGTADGQAVAVPLRHRIHQEQAYEHLLRERLPDHPLLRSDHALGYDESVAVKKAFIAMEWIDERPLFEIERRHEVWGGTVERLGEEFSRLLEAFAEIAAYEKRDARIQANLRTLAARLRLGVGADLLPLAPARTRWVGRRVLRRLLNTGIGTIDALRQTSSDRLGSIVGKLAAGAIRDHLEGASSVEPTVRKREVSGPRLVLIGEARSHGRATILVDGVERLVSRRHFEILHSLSTKDWLPLSEVGGDLDTARKEILRLRGKLATFLRLPSPEVLRTDGRKRYRLIVSIRTDQRSLRKHQPDLATSRP
jgi:helicase